MPNATNTAPVANNIASAGPQGNAGANSNTAASLEINKDLNMYKALLKNELLGTTIDSLTNSVLQPRRVCSVFQVIKGYSIISERFILLFN